jgi:hypothetical protein
MQRRHLLYSHLVPLCSESEQKVINEWRSRRFTKMLPVMQLIRKTVTPFQLFAPLIPWAKNKSEDNFFVVVSILQNVNNSSASALKFANTNQNLANFSFAKFRSVRMPLHDMSDSVIILYCKLLTPYLMSCAFSSERWRSFRSPEWLKTVVITLWKPSFFSVANSFQ